MILLYLILAVVLLKRARRSLSSVARRNITILILISIVGMIAYELYVEYAVGWQYGVPFDDDTGWIFRAATAMKNGVKWDRLYLSALDSDWNTSRVLSFSTLGQYIYAAIVSSALYYPLIFDVRINLYLIYLFQILMVSAAIVECISALQIWCVDNFVKQDKRKTNLFILLFFYPAVIINTYKLLREAFFVFFFLKAFVAFMRAKENPRQLKTLILYSLCLLIIRPHSIILTFTLIIWRILGERKAVICSLIISGVLLFGTLIVSKATQILGWNYGFGTVNLYEMIHLLLFPDPISQTQNMMSIVKNHSWVTILYFFQSLWNIPILIVSGIGIYRSLKAKKNYIWMIIWINMLMVYSLAYSVENMTPRYKLIYLIPQTVMLYIGLAKIKRNRSVRM